MKRLMDFPVILFLALTLDRAVLTAGYILLFGFGLALNAAHAFGEAPCQVADPVRLQLNGIEYRIPAALQPYYSPERALATRDYFPKGVRIRQYCQSPQSPPAVVDSISFPRNSLIAWAREDVDRAELVSIFPLAIKRSLRSDFAVAEGGQTTPDGLLEGQGSRSFRSSLCFLARSSLQIVVPLGPSNQATNVRSGAGSATGHW